MKLVVEKGHKYGMLTVVKEVEPKRLPSGQTNRCFLCKCNCGKEKVIRLVHLKNNKTLSCGCLYRYGETEKEKYIRKIWRTIKYRTSEKYSERHYYYDRGISVCDEWINDYESFKSWAMKNNLRKGYHIDRIDGNKGYNSNNCRVVTPTENANNKDCVIKVIYKGEKYTFMNLCREKNIKSHNSVRRRLKRGWTVEDAFDKPMRVMSKKINL